MEKNQTRKQTSDRTNKQTEIHNYFETLPPPRIYIYIYITLYFSRSPIFVKIFVKILEHRSSKSKETETVTNGKESDTQTNK